MKSSRLFRVNAALVAVLLLVALTAVACSSKTAASSKVTLHWMEWMTPEIGDTAVKQILDAFEKDHPNITIERDTLPFGQIHDKIVALNVAKQLPDVMMMNSPWVVEFAQLGVLQPLNSYLSKADKTWVDQLVQAPMSPWKGNTYQLPVTSIPFLLFYNVDILKAAGFSGPPTTWDQLQQMAIKTTDPAKEQYGLASGMALKSPYNGGAIELFPLIYQQGTTTIKDGKANINSPEAVKAVQFYVDLVNKYKVYAPGVLTNTENDKVTAFASGHIAFMTGNAAQITIIKRRDPSLNFSVAPYPKGVTTGTRLTGWNIAMSSQSKYKDAAWTFMQWLASPKGDALLAEVAGQLPGNTAAVVPAVQKDPMLQTAAEVLKEPGVMAEDVSTPQNTELWRILVEQVQEALQGQKTVQQAMNDAANSWNAVLAKYE